MENTPLQCTWYPVELKICSSWSSLNWRCILVMGWFLSVYFICNLTLPHMLSDVCQGSVCVSFELWPLTALPCSAVGTWPVICAVMRGMWWRGSGGLWVSASWIVPFRWPLALFSSLSHLDPCGPVRWVCVWGGGKLAFLCFWSICSSVELFSALSATVKRSSEW